MGNSGRALGKTATWREEYVRDRTEWLEVVLLDGAILTIYRYNVIQCATVIQRIIQRICYTVAGRAEHIRSSWRKEIGWSTRSTNIKWRRTEAGNTISSNTIFLNKTCSLRSVLCHAVSVHTSITRSSSLISHGPTQVMVNSAS
jgi:hypothetical protein